MTAPTAPNSTPTIGVFDSGFGGLTVLRALHHTIPHARYIYLGDTARLPYGSKSRETVLRYALSSAHFLIDQGAECLVIACNTASALALDDLRATLPIPVLGVIQPGAEAARTASSSPNASVLVLATSATVQSHAYAHALLSLGLTAFEKACPLLVPLVEEGWLSDASKLAVTSEVLRVYLTEALEEAPGVQTLVLGCTHYPLLQPLIESTLARLGHSLDIVDSAAATAIATRELLAASQLPSSPTSSPCPVFTFYATDSTEKFQQLGSHFLGQPLGQVHLIDLGG